MAACVVAWQKHRTVICGVGGVVHSLPYEVASRFLEFYKEKRDVEKHEWATVAGEQELVMYMGLGIRAW